jgi:hypothetical protein
MKRIGSRRKVFSSQGANYCCCVVIMKKEEGRRREDKGMYIKKTSWQQGERGNCNS